jgi:hypothetical protein
MTRLQTHNLLAARRLRLPLGHSIYVVLPKMMIRLLIKKNFNREEKKEEKEELEEELRKKRARTEREDRHEGLYQISDQFVHKQLRKMHSK